MSEDYFAPVHPGEVLQEEFLRELGISQNKLARDLNIPPQRVNQIILKKRSVSVDTALRLSRYFGTTPNFWLQLQEMYELDMAKKMHAVEKISKEVVPLESRVAV